jgi:hypothetical protein
MEMMMTQTASPEDYPPDGLWEDNGRFYFQCLSCGNTTEWEDAPGDFEFGHYANVCGGSPRCLP